MVVEQLLTSRPISRLSVERAPARIKVVGVAEAVVTASVACLPTTSLVSSS